MKIYFLPHLESFMRKQKVENNISYTTPNRVLSICKLPFQNGSYRNGVCRELWALSLSYFSKYGLFSVNVPISDGFQLNSLRRYQKILKECSFRCKYLLNFACLTMKFYNCHHSSEHWGSFNRHYGSQHQKLSCIFPNIIYQKNYNFASKVAEI